MVKFSSRADQTYDTVITHLSRCVNKIGKANHQYEMQSRSNNQMEIVEKQNERELDRESFKVTRYPSPYETNEWPAEH
jgi:hypothetical protein